MPNESWRVPNIDAQTGEELVEKFGLVPQGMYTCKIIAFRPIKPSKSKEYMFYITIELEILDEELAGRKLYSSIAGYMPVMKMVMSTKEIYIGNRCAVRVGIRVFGDKHYNTADIIWQVPDWDMEV